MALQYSVTVRDAQNDQLESTISTSPKLQIRTGTPPANCAASDSGTLLCEMSLPSDWLTASSSGLKQKNGSWTGTGVNGPGTAGHFRIKNNAGTVCHMQGECGGTGSGKEMELDNTSINTGQTVTVTTFDLTRGNA